MTGRTTQTQPQSLTCEVTLLADLSADRPWTAQLVGWLQRVASPDRPLGWAGTVGGAGAADAAAVLPIALTELLDRGAVRRHRAGAATRLLAVHLDSWPGGPAPPWPAARTTVLLDAAAVRAAAAGGHPADPESLLRDLLAGGHPKALDGARPGPDGGPAVRPSGRTVLFISSNGTGMGHLTRLLAMARRSGPEVSPVFASMSQAVPVVDHEGYPWEYIPSKGDLGIGNRRWNALFERRMREMLARRRPEAIVFDGTYPYDGLFAAAADLPQTRLVWSRRGMWRSDGVGHQLARSSRFDLVIEPGDLAAQHDRGATAGRTDAVRVGPITLLDPDEQVDRRQAARALGIDPDRRTVLVTLGAGSSQDRVSALDLVVSRLTAEPDLQVVLTRPVIASQAGPVSDRVHTISVYPISRYLSAIDLAVAAAGYNSFHELVGAAVPTLFVPNLSAPLDDQPARARWADQVGAGLSLPAVTGPSVDVAVSRLLDRQERDRMARRCRQLRQPNGAAAAMAAVQSLCDRTERVSR